MNNFCLNEICVEWLEVDKKFVNFLTLSSDHTVFLKIILIQNWTRIGIDELKKKLQMQRSIFCRCQGIEIGQGMAEKSKGLLTPFLTMYNN